MSDDSKEKVEYGSADFDKYRACEINQYYYEDDAKMSIPLHSFSTFMPSYLYQSVAIKWCDRDEVEYSQCDIQIAEVYSKVDHKIDIIEENIIGSSSYRLCIDEYDEYSYNS